MRSIWTKSCYQQEIQTMNFTNVLTDYVKHNVIVIMNFSNYDQNISVTAKKKKWNISILLFEVYIDPLSSFQNNKFYKKGPKHGCLPKTRKPIQKIMHQKSTKSAYIDTRDKIFLVKLAHQLKL